MRDEETEFYTTGKLAMKYVLLELESFFMFVA